MSKEHGIQQGASEAIRQFVEQRRVKSLYHFTREDNLASIIEHGLLPRNTLERLGIRHVYNDHERLDGRKTTVSVSISFPNYRLFYHLRQRCNASWVILEIDPSVLWKQNCLFCQCNAADSEVRNLPDEKLKGVSALACMYDDDIREGSTNSVRKSEKLLDCEPTDVQAEVLVRGAISRENIRAVVVENRGQVESIRRDMPSIELSVKVDRDLFSKRGFRRSAPAPVS